MNASGAILAEQDSFDVQEAGDRWLRVQWTLSPKTMERADSAMGRDAAGAVRVLRLYRYEREDSSPASKALVQSIEIPPDAGEWFLRVPSVTVSWSVELGLVFGKQRFFSLLHSVPMMLKPHRATPSTTDRLLCDTSLADSLDTGNPPPLTASGLFVLSGNTASRALLTIDDQRVEVDSASGRFEWRLPLLNGREVFPILVSDGGRTQRALLAVEVNLHLLAPETDDDD